MIKSNTMLMITLIFCLSSCNRVSHDPDASVYMYPFEVGEMIDLTFDSIPKLFKGAIPYDDRELFAELKFESRFSGSVIKREVKDIPSKLWHSMAVDSINKESWAKEYKFYEIEYPDGQSGYLEYLVNVDNGLIVEMRFLRTVKEVVGEKGFPTR